MSHPLQHLSLSTSKRSLSPTSPVVRPSSPTLSCPLELDPETLRHSRRSGGFTEIPSPTGYDPKVIQSVDLEPRRIELNRNIGTDPYQIPERILGDHHRHPITEGTEEVGKVGVELLHVQSRIHSDYDSDEIIANSDLEDGELQKMLASPLYVHGRGEKLWFFSQTHSFTETRRKSYTIERGKCTTYSS